MRSSQQPSDDSSSSGASDKQTSPFTPIPTTSSGAGLNTGTATTSASASSNSTTTAQQRKQQRLVPLYPRRRPIPRKGHTKSRAGCSVCKGRKVKCDEAVPECGPCRRLGLVCDYAQRKRSRDADSSSYGDSSSHEGDGGRAVQLAASSGGNGGGSVAKSLSNTPSLFDIEDMRFFHHFIFSAHPPLPIGGAWVWRQISQMSYQYDFLVHAMLGLAASHLSLVCPNNYSQAALNHRIAAINALNSFLPEAHKSITNSEAALGATMILSYQVALLPDGMTEHLTLIRACYIVGAYLLGTEDSLFTGINRDIYVRRVLEIAVGSNGTPYLDKLLTVEFKSSVDNLAPLCKSSAESYFVGTMQKISSTVVDNPIECYTEHSVMFDKVAFLKAEDFSAFIDKQNPVSQLVIMHIFILDAIMVRKMFEAAKGRADIEGSSNAVNSRIVMLRHWVESISNSLPAEYRPYAAWAVSFTQGPLISLFLDADIDPCKPIDFPHRTTTIKREANVIELNT